MSYRKTAVALAVLLAAQTYTVSAADKVGHPYQTWNSSEVSDIKSVELNEEANTAYKWQAALLVKEQATGTVSNLVNFLKTANTIRF